MTFGSHISKRKLLGGLGAAALAVPGADAASRKSTEKWPERWDVIVVGGGNAGLPLAIFAAQRGARVLVIEAAAQVGGTLFLSTGQMSAAGTKFQKQKGIEDTAQEHFDDVMRIGHGTANPDILRLAVENNADTADWLFDNGFEARPEHPVFGMGHDPYSKRRYFWGMEGGISILKILEKALKPQIDNGRVKLLLETEAKELILAKGAVVGVVTKGPDGKEARHMGRHIALTSGGYGSNPAMFEKMEGVKDFGDTTYPYSQGIGLTLAISAGGYLRGQQCHQPLFNAILADDDFPSPMRIRITSDPSVRKPWEIWVNQEGRRFIREDEPTHDAKEKALAKQRNERCWIVFDQTAHEQSPPISRAWTKQELTDAFGRFPMFYKANSIAELAAATGVDGNGLAATVAAYNAAQAGGKDSLGRAHMPLKIEKAPFYAIRMQGYYLLDIVGVAVDAQLRVIRQDGKPIPNLYAAGELLGMAALQGQCYAGGMSVTPALTFGRLLGQKLLNLA